MFDTNLIFSMLLLALTSWVEPLREVLEKVGLWSMISVITGLFAKNREYCCINILSLHLNLDVKTNEVQRPTQVRLGNRELNLWW